MKRAPKYHNQTITMGGERYDSKKEFRRWHELRLMEAAGLIKDLQRQVKFVLIPSQKKEGKVIARECAYIADFVYQEKIGLNEWQTVVEDAKGMKTEVYKIKKKLMLWVHGIEIKEV